MLRKLVSITPSFLTCVLIVTILFSGTGTNAQETKELLKIKTFKELREIIDASPAITGLMVTDLTSGESMGINEHAVFTQASAIKVAILMEVYKQASLKVFSLTDHRVINPATAVGGSGILKDFADPVSLSIRNLCVLMMSQSDNTATNTMIDLVSPASINVTLQSLGFKETKLNRKMITPAASGRGEENISTPAEAARMLQVLYKGEFINKTISAEILSIIAKNPRRESRLAIGIPAHVPVLFKEGALAGVSTEWAIINLKERPYILAIMENYKVEGKSTDVLEKISALLYEYFWRLGNATRYGTYVDPALIKAAP